CKCDGLKKACEDSQDEQSEGLHTNSSCKGSDAADATKTGARRVPIAEMNRKGGGRSRPGPAGSKRYPSRCVKQTCRRHGRERRVLLDGMTGCFSVPRVAERCGHKPGCA